MKRHILLFLIAMSVSWASWAQSASASFQSTDITTTGQAQLTEEGSEQVIELSDDFTTEEGPDLHVYLATDTTATEFTDLGLLEDFSGKQTYEVPGDVALEEQSVLLIYCKKYSHLFGYAELQ